ncbi:MAG: TonB-dependent receptor [Bacteroidia bacterium]|nr:TonB-dependent receptor [Bacteroidia bacterium]
MKHFLMKCVLLGFATLLFTTIRAQQNNYTVVVRVNDDINHPIEYATVHLSNATHMYNAQSLLSGKAQLVGVATGEYILRIHQLQYADTAITLVVSKNTDITIKLNHNTNNLHEVHIHNERAPVIATQNYWELNAVDLLQQQGKPLAKMLEQLPGVTTLNTGASVSKPVINGLHSNRVLVLNNGVRQEGQQWGAEHAPEIDPFNAGNITVIKGANAIQYGSDAVAGVVLISPATLPDSVGVNGSALLNLQSNGKQIVPAVMVQQRFKHLPNLAYRVQASGKEAGNMSTPNYIMGNTGTKELNGSVLIEYSHKAHHITLNVLSYNTELGIFRGSHIGNLTDLNRAIANTGNADSATFLYLISRPKQSVNHITTMVHYKTLVGKYGVLNVQYAFQTNRRKEFDNHNVYVNNVLQKNAPQSALELFTHTVDASYEYTTASIGHGKLGVNYMNQINNNLAQSRVFIPNYQSNNAGLYYLHYAHINKFNVELGIRQDLRNSNTYERNSSNGLYSRTRAFNATLGSLGVSYYATNNIKLIVNSGLAWRAPSPNELYSNGLHHGVAAIEYGNDHLNVERALNNSLAINSNFLAHRITVNAEVFYNHFFNFINLVPVLPATLTIRGAFPTFKFEQMPAQLFGTNAQISYAVNERIKWTSVFSSVRGYNTLNNSFLLGLPSDRLLNELTYTIKKTEHKNYYAGITHTWVDKQTRVNYAADYSIPPSAYNLVGCNVTANLTLKNNNKLTLLLTANNLLNTVYRDYMNRFKYYANDIGRNVSATVVLTF